MSPFEARLARKEAAKSKTKEIRNLAEEEIEKAQEKKLAGAARTDFLEQDFQRKLRRFGCLCHVLIEPREQIRKPR